MAADRPNIVLILTDQHRGDALGIEGFVAHGELVTGSPHDLFIPDYDPTQLYPCL